MIKKLTALAASALFSLNASAGYVQYDFSGDRGLSGYFVQNEKDLSIAAYAFSIDDYPYEFFQPGYNSNISWTRARYNNKGPSRFAVYDGGSEAYFSTIWFNFTSTNTPGTYAVTSYFSARQDEAWPTGPGIDKLKPVVHYFGGTVTAKQVDAEQAAYFDLFPVDGMYPDGLNVIVPKLNVIPEPTSIALLALGVAGLAGALRRRKEKS